MELYDPIYTIVTAIFNINFHNQFSKYPTSATIIQA